MCPILNRNAIMTGYVDSFCLACETHLRSDEDALTHIAKPIHKKNLEASTFLDKFKEDRVRKVKKGYYCEFCNVFMKTTAKVGPHVAETKHCDNKGMQPLKREGNGILAFNKVFIPDNAWHGMIDNTCAVCDAEFDNAQIHKTETSHILSLVLIEIEFSADQNIYRKVDDATFQCLTCNEVCAQNALTTHFEDSQHKKLYQKCCEAAKTKVNEPKQGTETKEEDKQKEKEPTKKENAKKSPVKETAKEEKPAKTPEPEKVKEEPKKTPDTEKKQEVKKTKSTQNGTNKDKMGKTDQDICKTLGAVDFIARDVCGKQWCILCDWAMDDHSIQAHVKSKHHQTLLKMHKKRAEEKQPESDEGSDEANNDVDPKALAKTKILDSADEFQKNDIKLDFVDGSAFCRICSKSIDFDCDFIRNHIEEHKKKPAKAIKTDVKPFPSGSDKTSTTNLFTSPVRKNETKAKQEKEKESRASSVASNRDTDVDAENFAKQHDLTYNRENNNAFCRVCVTKVPASLKNMREHINGISHKNKVAKVDVKPNVTAVVKEPSHVFVDSIITIENMFSKDIVINEKYCVNILSFMMVTRCGSKLRCQACEINVTVSMVDEHKNTPRHERTMNDAPVVSSEESEFIREIRPNIFHCGFCNQLESSWRTMESHLKSTAHREAKTAANWRLQEYAPMIMQHKARRHMEFMLFSRMLMAQMFGAD